MSSRPRRILITRSSGQSSALAEGLRSLGAEPILIPTIEIVEPASYAVLDSELARLDGFHWAIFTSANAVEAFHRRTQNYLGGGSIVAKESELKVAVIGPATARALEAVGLTPSLVPPQAVAESLAACLLPYARQPNGAPTRFLLIRAEQGRDHLPETLRAAGAEITVATAYRTVIPQGSIDAIRDLFSSPENYPDAITFTSSSTARNLIALLETVGLGLPPDILRVSIGPITSETLTGLGYPPQLEAEESNMPSLLAALVKRFSLK